MTKAANENTPINILIIISIYWISFELGLAIGEVILNG